MNGYDKIRLRPFVSNDADEHYQLLSDGRVQPTTASIPFPYHEHHSRAWIQGVLARQSISGKRRELAIEFLDTGRLAGVISVQDVVSRVGNVAYWVGPPYWGRGIATEAVRLAIQQNWLMEFDILEGRHLTANPASGFVLKRNDFVLVGTETRDWRNTGLQELQVYRRCLRDVIPS